MPIAKKPGAHHQAHPTRNEDVAAEAFIAKAGNTQGQDDEGRKVPVTMRYDPAILKRVDSAAKRLGISRSAYVHIALSRLLEQE